MGDTGRKGQSGRGQSHAESEAQRGHSPQVCANGWGKTRAGQSWDGSREPLARGGSPDKGSCPTQGQQCRALPHGPARAGAGLGRDPVSLPCVGHRGHEQNLARGSVRPAPARAACATLQRRWEARPKAIQWDNRWPIVARPNLAAQAGTEQSQHTSAGAKAGGESALHPLWHRGQDGHRHLLGLGLSPQTPWQQPRAWGGASNGDFLCFV